MSQQDLFDYVMNTPYNTNPAILKQKIKENSGVSSWNDLKDKPFYTETVQKSETREFTNSLVDAEFAALLYANRQTAQYIIDGVQYTFKNDEQPPMGYGWNLGTANDSDMFVAIVDGDIQIAGNVSITVNYEEETVHKLNAKYLPSAIPKKLSDLENDLWYSKKERFLTLTKEDFVPWNNPDEYTEYLYISSPKLEWLTSANAIAWELSITGADGQSMIFTQDDMPMRVEDGYTDDGSKCVDYVGDAPFWITSGADYKNWDAILSKDEFTVVVPSDIYNEVDAMILKIYRVDEKKIPIEYCDTSEIEDEIVEINGEVI